MPTLRGVIILPPSQPRFLARLPLWQKGKTTKTKDDTAAPVLYEKLIYSDKTKKIMSLFRSKGNDKVNPFDYLYQYCKVKMALIIESIYLSKNVISLQIKASEVYVTPLNARKALLAIKESDDEEDEIKTRNISDVSDIEEDKTIFNTLFCIINQPNH